MVRSIQIHPGDNGAILLDDCAADELRDLVVRVASGDPSRPEALGYREYFIMYEHQSAPEFEAGCHA